MSTNRWRLVPWLIVFCISALVGLGLSGIARGDELAGSSQFYAKQLIWVGVAGFVLLVVNLFNYRTLARFSLPIFCLAVVLLCVVFVFRPINGARRWIPLGFMSFQPSEVTKLAYIIALASYLRFRENYRRMSGLAAPFAMTLLPMALIYKEPNLGTCLLFLPVLFAMLFTAGARPRHLIAVILLGACLTPVLWLGMSREQRSRVSAMVLQNDGGGAAVHDDGDHLHRSKRVIALGGTWGSEIDEPLVNDPVAYYVPEARTDFIFCMIAERWGFVGCCLTLSLYAALYGQGLLIAAATRDPFGRLLAVGIVTLFATQTIINTAMTVGLMPITGITLPLLSYGGSSLATTCLALGLLINVGLHQGYEMRGQPFRFASG
ncbi:MAG: FtsW/RodA/SpoVE family cell cycle protein [Planctomycetota bacterium]